VEIEIKLAVKNLAAARRRLRTCGFRRTSPRLLERNLVLDTPRGSLHRSRQLLRLRWAAGSCWLTWKGPPQPDRPHKIREEIELEVRSGEDLAGILERLGYRVHWEYHKYRTQFHLPSRGRGKLLLDQTPMGDFLELEGPPAWIDRTAALLGYRAKDYILESYWALYRSWRSWHRRSPVNMLFPGKKNLRRGRA